MKKKGRYYVSYIAFTSYYHQEEGGYCQEGNDVLYCEECQTFKKALKKLRRWLKKTDLKEEARCYQEGSWWIAHDKQSFGVRGRYIGDGFICKISRHEPQDIGFIPYC